ncbi:MAG: hypothetical protein HDKAJFGB_00842 [Anaerolineae bacterium]|nr:hypothetical protein [Anaerolineae bacterium]
MEINRQIQQPADIQHQLPTRQRADEQAQARTDDAIKQRRQQKDQHHLGARAAQRFERANLAHLFGHNRGERIGDEKTARHETDD